MTDTPQITDDHRLALTQQELDYLAQFLAAHDRAAFYLAYNAFVSSEAALPFVDTNFGKREASLQAKISSFSEEVGAAAYLANRLLQEQHIDADYKGIYFLSQQVADSAFEAMTDDHAQGGDGLIDDETHYGDTLLNPQSWHNPVPWPAFPAS